MSRRKHHQSDNAFLAQILIAARDEDGTRCQSIQHTIQKPPIAIWELRFYQDIDLADRLLKQGIDQDRINQIGWDRACKEQDTIGVRNYKTLLLCSDCVQHVATKHGGKGATVLSMTTAMMTGDAFLLVSDRDTEVAAIVGNLPRGVQEEDILPLLQQEQKIDIHFKK